MPISYGYEGELAWPAVKHAEDAGFRQGVAGARRFGAQLQQQYDQMSQQRYMQQQQHMQDRWNAQAQHQSSTSRIAQQGMINKTLQEQAQTARMDELGQRHKYSQVEQEQYMQLKEQYNQTILDQELDAKGQMWRNDLERKRELLGEALAGKHIDEFQYRQMEAELMQQGLGKDWDRRGTKEGTWVDSITGHHYKILEDGTQQDLGEVLPSAGDRFRDGDIIAKDINGRTIKPDPETGDVNLENAPFWILPDGRAIANPTYENAQKIRQVEEAARNKVIQDALNDYRESKRDWAKNKADIEASGGTFAQPAPSLEQAIADAQESYTKLLESTRPRLAKPLTPEEAIEQGIRESADGTASEVSQDEFLRQMETAGAGMSPETRSVISQYQNQQVRKFIAQFSEAEQLEIGKDLRKAVRTFNDAQIAVLPPGTIFITPDGQLKKK